MGWRDMSLVGAYNHQRKGEILKSPGRIPTGRWALYWLLHLDKPEMAGRIPSARVECSEPVDIRAP